jgi:uncharacterized membrane protein (DUF4010 family)
MLAACGGVVLLGRKSINRVDSVPNEPLLTLQSPFSLRFALKFGFILVVIQIAGVFGQQMLGQFGVYATSLLGGLFSSSSAVAAAAALAAQGTIADRVAGNCAVIASLTSVIVNLPLVVGVADHRLVRRIAWAVSAVALVGVLGILAQSLWGLPSLGRIW